MLHPDFHHRSRLTTSDGTTYETYGNLTLLHDPDIEAVNLSRTQCLAMNHLAEQIAAGEWM